MNKKFEINASVLKVIAYLTMTIDHVTGKLYLPYLQNIQGLSGTEAGKDFFYILGRGIGRMAFILFCFMLLQGMRYTKNRWKYIGRLLIFAVISEFPFDFAKMKLWDSDYQNVFFTLAACGVLLMCYELVEEAFDNKGLAIVIKLLLLVVICAALFYLKTDYKITGPLVITAMWHSRMDMARLVPYLALALYTGAFLTTALNYFDVFITFERMRLFLTAPELEMWGLMALIPIYYYNGKKGKQLPKLLYYVFYPVHLLIIGGIAFIYLQ